MSKANDEASSSAMQAILPSQGIVLFEQPEQFVLCKPKLLPLKSWSWLRMERLQQDAEQKAKEQLRTQTSTDDA